MTTRTNDDSTQRDRSPRQDRGAAGSVLQALCDLGLQPTPPDSPRAQPRPIPPAFLPARPGKASRRDAGTGYIDVRALAAQVRRSETSTSTMPASPIRAASPGPTTSDRRPDPPPLAAAPFARSARRSQLQAFLLGVVCTGALLGTLLVRHATGPRTDMPKPAPTGQHPVNAPHR